jgi:hypothetical protein
MTELVHKMRRILALYPRRHVALAALLAMFLSAAALLVPSTPAEANRTAIPLSLQLQTATTEVNSSNQNPANTDSPATGNADINSIVTISDATLNALKAPRMPW